MSFLAPGWLLLSVLALPILILHMLRLRHREVQVSSTLLWQRLLDDRQANASWQRLKRNLLLLLQLLILATLIFAMARPAFSVPNLPSGSVIILLDASASMNARDASLPITTTGMTRFAAARMEARKIITDLPGHAQMTLVRVARQPEILVSATRSKAELLRALAAVQPSQESAGWEAAFVLAAAVAAGSSGDEQQAEIIMISDGGLPEMELPSLPVPVRYIPAGQESENLAISALALRPAGNEVELFASVSNYGLARNRTLVSFYAGESLFHARQLDLLPGQSQNIVLNRLPGETAQYTARLSPIDRPAPLDALSLDDAAYAVSRPQRTGRALLVSRQNLFLEQLLANLPGIQPFRALPAGVDGFTLPNETFDVYIFDGFLPAELPSGNLLLVNPPPNELFLVSGILAQPANATVLDHPLTEHVDWRNVHVLQARRVQPPGWAEVLVEVEGGPLVFAGEDRGRRIAAITFDLHDSDLPLQVAFPVLFSNLIDYLVYAPVSDPTAGAISLQPGDSLTIPPEAGVNEVEIVTPGGQLHRLQMGEDGAHFTGAHEAGIYSIAYLGQTGRGLEYFAVNLFDPLESTIRPASAIQVGLMEVVPDTADNQGYREFWPWLVIFALAILALEWWLYHHRQTLPGNWWGSLRMPRKAFSFGLRLLIGLCLVLSLTGLEIARASDRLAVVFLIDASDSMPASAQAAALDYVQQAMDQMKTGDQAAVVVFGGDALVERAMSSHRELRAITSIPQPNQTDLEKAIRLGLALFPPEAARRMVILSDGNATTGYAQLAAQLATASGVQILAVPFDLEPGSEVLLAAVDAPARLRLGERFDLRLTLEASQPTPAKIRVFAGEQQVYEGDHELKRGTQSFSLPLAATEVGFTRYLVQVESQTDGFYQNNELSALIYADGPPRILLVSLQTGETGSFPGEDRPDESAHLQRVLDLAGFEVRVTSPGQMPSDLVSLSSFAGLVLVDVPARALSQRQMSAVQSYVRDLGGGLVAVGGTGSFGVGGYFRTPLEETLPVDMQIQDEQRRPSLSIVYVIDRSASMADTGGGVQKLELAKEAAIRSIEMLHPGDRAGVVAFDASASWVVPLAAVENQAELRNAVGRLRSGGGTDILAGLQAVASVLPQDSDSLKHVILLTDGGADPAGIPELVERLHRENGITLTAVGVGQDAASYLPQLALVGGGRYHFTDDPSTIPLIFSEETSLAGRAYLVERSFSPQQIGASPILSEIRSLPQLHGYVGTSIKATAQAVLVSDLGDPILATWQYGLGKALAFTSDASGHWAQDWVVWDQFPLFWAQAVGSTLRDPSDSPLEIRIEQRGGLAQLMVDAQTNDGVYLNNYDLQANLVTPNGRIETLSLKQFAPGRYSATFIPTAQGAYLFRFFGEYRENSPADSAAVDPSLPAIAETAVSTTAISTTAGWVLPYSPEYRLLAADPPALARLAALSGGSIVEADPRQIFTHNLPAARAPLPAWPVLLFLAALLLPVDLAARRLVLSPQELRHALERTALSRAARLSAVHRPTLPRTARSPGVQALFNAKQRAFGGREESSNPGSASRAISEENRADLDVSSSQAGDKMEPSSSPHRAEEPSNTVSGLLASKRKKNKLK